MIFFIPEHLRQIHIKDKPPGASCSGWLIHNQKLCHCYTEERKWLEHGLRPRQAFARKCIGIIYDQRPRPPRIG